MTSHSILYVVNADGSGHTRRAEAILQHLDVPVVVASENPGLFKGLSPHTLVCRIPPLRLDGDRQLADDALHVPYGSDRAYLDRVQTMVELCDRHRCSLAVIDVCAETAMLMRLCGIPYLYMRMNGRRDDAAHFQSYRAAAGLIASYPQPFEEDWVPSWMREKTCYVGGISTQPPPKSLAPVSQTPYVLIMRGKGVSQLTPAAIASASALVSDYRWIGIGFDQAQRGDNFEILPYVADSERYVQQAAIVIANTGNNSVLEIGHEAKPFITAPEWRFFEEQTTKAAQLAKHNLAVVLTEWPQTGEAWQAVLTQANRLDSNAWPKILSTDGAERAANYISEQFALVSPRSVSSAA